MRKELQTFIDEVDYVGTVLDEEENAFNHGMLTALAELFAAMEPKEIMQAVNEELLKLNRIDEVGIHKAVNNV